MARKKTVVEKIAEVVDHVIHPEASEPQPEKAKTPYQEHMGKWDSKAEKAKENKSSEADLDFQMHPKFHKFKSTDQGAD